MSEINVPINVPGQPKENPKNFGIQLLPDIAFLRQLSIQGRLRYIQGTTSTIFTPQNGETFFFLSAIYTNTSTMEACTFTLANDGMTREIVVLTVLQSGMTPTLSSIKMDSLVGNGTKTIGVTASDGIPQVTLVGWVENTSRIRDVTT